jgi:YidC/Oxa1 family membrane protein insertase
MQKLQPQLKKLQEQHKNDKQAFAQAQMDLFREHQVSPFGSCLPMLLPLPVFFALFRVLEGLGRTTPKYLSPNTRMYKDIVASHGNLYAFGMNLSKNAFSPHSSVWAALPYWILVVVMGVTGYLQSAQMMSRNPNAAQNPQMRMMKYLPLAFTVIFIRFPAGVLLYYATSNICRIVQQDLMYRFDPKVKALVAQEVIEVEELTEEIDHQQADRQRGGRRGTSKPAESPPASSGGSTSGRSRFREILAQATEQQKKPPPPKPPPPKPAATGPPGGQAAEGSSPSNGSGTGSTSSNGTPSDAPATNGQAGGGRTGASPNGQRRARKPPPKSTPGGHKTNRKRRGK